MNSRRVVIILLVVTLGYLASYQDQYMTCSKGQYTNRRCYQTHCLLTLPLIDHGQV